MKISRLGFLIILITLFVKETRAEHRQAPEKFRPLSSTKSYLKGTDITVQGVSGKWACQSAPVAKKKLESPEGQCRLAYLTAAHCVEDPFQSIDFSGIGEIKKSSMYVSIPREYFQNSNKNSREPSSGDSATIIFDFPCDKVESVIPVPLAPVDSEGKTDIGSTKVYLQKRQGSVGWNRGESAQIEADVTGADGSMFEFYSPSPQGYTTVGGDSGGPVFNEKGQLVAPISGSSYEYLRATGRLKRIPDGSLDKVLDPFTVVCDSRAVSRLRSDLEKFGLSPVSTAEAESLSQQASQAPSTEQITQTTNTSSSLKALFQ